MTPNRISAACTFKISFDDCTILYVFHMLPIVLIGNSTSETYVLVLAYSHIAQKLTEGK